jgi:hypothetical protein
VAKTTRRQAQLRGQQLPAKKGKVRARLVQTAQIQDWDNLTPEQQQEALNWGIDIDVDDSSDSDEDMSGQAGGSTTFTVTDLQGPPSECTQMEKIRDLKSLARQYARDQGSCDDTRISYLEYVESEAEADWTLARMIAG